jgi:hypothetical protein
MRNIFRFISLVVVVVSIALAAGARESQADKKRSSCTKAKPCADCATANGCTRKCKGASCKFTHSGVGGADFYCTSGKCTLDHTGAGGSDLWCKGGGCVLNHSGVGSSTLHCPGGGCTLVATGAGTSELVECPNKDCKLECHGGAGTCELEGVEVPAQ